MASWAKVSPGNNESAGKRYRVPLGRAIVGYGTGLVQAAWAAIKVKRSYLSSLFIVLMARAKRLRCCRCPSHAHCDLSYAQ